MIIKFRREDKVVADKYEELVSRWLYHVHIKRVNETEKCWLQFLKEKFYVAYPTCRGYPNKGLLKQDLPEEAKKYIDLHFGLLDDFDDWSVEACLTMPPAPPSEVEVWHKPVHGLFYQSVYVYGERWKRGIPAPPPTAARWIFETFLKEHEEFEVTLQVSDRVVANYRDCYDPIQMYWRLWSLTLDQEERIELRCQFVDPLRGSEEFWSYFKRLHGNYMVQANEFRYVMPPLPDNEGEPSRAWTNLDDTFVSLRNTVPSLFKE